jgi:hypothetical protein
VAEEMGDGRTQIMNILKENVRFWRFWKQCSQFKKTSTSCNWICKHYQIMLGLVSEFCLLIIFIYLFACFIQIISYSDNFINNKCKQ